VKFLNSEKTEFTLLGEEELKKYRLKINLTPPYNTTQILFIDKTVECGKTYVYSAREEWLNERTA
jgi:hypothetical protein